MLIFLVSYINQNKTTIIEGELRIKELNHYLECLKLEKLVWLCEDGSSIVSKVDFDPKTNQMVGLVLPFNSSTGMPITFTYLAENEDEIYKNMRSRMSSHVYLVMAQPMMIGVPPFIIQLFGTDNTFKTQNVLLRWKFIKAELER